MMLVAPWLTLEHLECDPDIHARMSVALARAVVAMARGQAAEPFLDEACRDGRGTDAYLDCIALKTGALFGVCVEGAALLAGLPVENAASLAEAFKQIGVLFQLQDDVLDLFGDKGRDHAGNDLREGTVSALVVEHLAAYPDDVEELLGLLASPREETSCAQVDEWTRRFTEDGALDAALERISRLAGDVVDAPALQSFPPLRELARGLIEIVLAPIAHLMPLVGDSPAGTEVVK
jgi:geranylgeranyl diphosphate synthase type I